MTFKELCEACRHITREIGAIEKQLNRIGIIDGFRDLSFPARNNFPSRTNRSFISKTQEINAYEQLLLRKHQEAVDLLFQFERLLEQVPDTTDRAILRYYYGAGWTDERIAEEMNLTDRTVRGRRSVVLNKMANKESS